MNDPWDEMDNTNSCTMAYVIGGISGLIIGILLATFIF